MKLPSLIFFIGTVIGGATLVSAQPPARVYKVGFLASSASHRLTQRLSAFRQGLHDLGYTDGKTIVIEYRSAEGEFQRLPDLAGELIRLKVDVILAEGAPAAHAAKNATAAIPIVIGNAADPVGTGLVASLAAPGGNVTGLSDFNLGVVTKRLELIKEVVPQASRIAVLWNPRNPTNLPQLKEIEAVAPSLKVKLFPLEARKPEDIDRVFSALAKERLGALVVIGDPMFGSHVKGISKLATDQRLPVIYSSADNVDEGGLMSYGTNFAALYRRAATYVDKILKGTKPADLPIEQPLKFDLTINLKAAKQIGLKIPPNVLARADRVIR